MNFCLLSLVAGRVEFSWRDPSGPLAGDAPGFAIASSGGRLPSLGVAGEREA